MNLRVASAALLLVAAALFFVIGFRSVPRNTTYVVLGVVFAILALARFRRARHP